MIVNTNKGGYIHIVVAIHPICALYKRMIPVNDATQRICIEIFGEKPPSWHHYGDWFKFTGFDVLHDIDAK